MEGAPPPPSNWPPQGATPPAAPAPPSATNWPASSAPTPPGRPGLDGPPAAAPPGRDEESRRALARAAATPKRFSKGDLASMVFLGWFFGLLFGGGIHNGMGVLTPLETVPGTVTRIELDVDFSRPATSTSRYTHWIEGTTDDGRTWRIANQSAYETLEAEGYPQAVEVGMGEWTGNAERVAGETWEVDQQDTGQAIFVVVWMAVLVAGGLITVVWLLRSPKYGIVPALVFAVSFFVLGGYTGELAFGWIQSG